MLPPYIIEQIRRREEEEARPQQPVIELPIPTRRAPLRESEPPGEQRGVIIIDL